MTTDEKTGSTLEHRTCCGAISGDHDLHLANCAIGPNLATADDVIEGRARYADTPGGHADRKTKTDESEADRG